MRRGKNSRHCARRVTCKHRLRLSCRLRFSAPIICASVCLLLDIHSSPFFRTNHTQLCAERGDQVTGARTSGFRLSRWGHVQKVKPGDYLLCYLSRVSCWVGLLEVQSEAYLDNTTRIWKAEVYPCRLDVQLLQSLPVKRAVPIRELADRLSIFQRPRWNFHLIGSPTKWKEEDARVVIEAINRKATVAQ